MIFVCIQWLASTLFYHILVTRWTRKKTKRENNMYRCLTLSCKKQADENKNKENEGRERDRCYLSWCRNDNERGKIRRYIQAKFVNRFSYVWLIFVFDLHQTVTVRTNTKRKQQRRRRRKKQSNRWGLCVQIYTNPPTEEEEIDESRETEESKKTKNKTNSAILSFLFLS